MSECKYEFEGLRGVGRVELNFVPEQQVYALFGVNGVGKTKCLEALFQYYLLSCEPFMTQTRMPLGGDFYVASRLKSALNEFLVMSSLPKGIINSGPQLRPMQGHSLPVVFLAAGERGHIPSEHAKSGLAVGTFEHRRKRYFDSIVTGMREHFSSLGMHADLEQWFVTLAQSINPYQKLGDSRKVELDTLLQALHQIDERYDPSFMEIDGDNRVFLKVAGIPTELRNLSTGFTSLVKMLQAIISGYANFTNEVSLTRVRGVVFIDEIESHLHVKWQSSIVVLLKKLFPNTTFFIATHSPIVLSQLHSGEAYLLKRGDDGVVHSQPIENPDKRILADVLAEVLDVNLNHLKVERMTPESQKDAKAQLLDLLNAGGGVPHA